MTDPQPGHGAFDELAAGYVLHALEPADERRFVQHAGDCPRCRRLVAGFREVAVALAETAPSAEPSGELGDRILAAALSGSGPEPASSGRVVPLHGRRRRWRRAAVAAAAAAVVAGGGIWGGLAATASGRQPPLAACARPHVCTQITLTATATGRTAGTVIVHDGVAWMRPGAMTANPADEIYVLWQITGSRIPLPVGSFDVRTGTKTAVRVGGLAAPYAGTWAFAVSLEHGRTIPAKPSKPVALGQVS